MSIRCLKKIAASDATLAAVWRRWRDLNPRTPCGAYRISNPDPSATWVHLQFLCYYATGLRALQGKSAGRAHRMKCPAFPDRKEPGYAGLYS